MKKAMSYLFAAMILARLGGAVVAARAEMPPADQEALRTQHVGKVLIFRKSYRMLDRLEVAADGTVKGNHQSGYWAVDGAVQVKDMEFKKERVTMKCTKLWANIKDDGQLHYFPVSAALKGNTDYPENMEIVFRTGSEGESLDEFNKRVSTIFLGAQDSKLSATPAPISAYIQKSPMQVDINPISGPRFDGTPPKPISTPTPNLTREALLAGQAGREDFVVFVDQEGRSSVVGFTRLLQFGLEEATMEAVRKWKFEPAMQEGRPVAVRIPMFIEYKRPAQQ